MMIQNKMFFCALSFFGPSVQCVAKLCTHMKYSDQASIMQTLKQPEETCVDTESFVFMAGEKFIKNTIFPAVTQLK